MLHIFIVPSFNVEYNNFISEIKEDSLIEGIIEKHEFLKFTHFYISFQSEQKIKVIIKIYGDKITNLIENDELWKYLTKNVQHLEHICKHYPILQKYGRKEIIEQTPRFDEILKLLIETHTDLKEDEIIKKFCIETEYDNEFEKLVFGRLIEYCDLHQEKSNLYSFDISHNIEKLNEIISFVKSNYF
jgi:hypothetical protein